MSEQDRQIAIVDDDAAVLKSLAALLGVHGYDTHAFHSADDFLERSGERIFDCLLLDIRMPGMTGLELQAALKEKNKTYPIVFITAHGDIPMAVEAIRAGAIEFIEKPFSDKTLLAAIDRALASGPMRDEGRSQRADASERLSKLTSRERDVFEHLAMGETSKAIARTLGISQRTVEVHRANIKSKLETETLSDLIRIKQTLSSA